MRLLFSPPSLDDLIRLLRAWRFWLLAALIGALLGGAFHIILPPPYRARAVVNVDFNLEQAWPQETDRQQFYYLERETRKLEEIAWSDEVMQKVASAEGGLSIRALRDSRLTLGQPAEGGWHFYASDADPARAGLLAGVWARSFAEAAQADAGSQAGLSSFVTLEVTQSEDLLVKRSVPLSTYLLSGTLAAWCVSVLAVLFFNLGQLRLRQQGEAVTK